MHKNNPKYYYLEREKLLFYIVLWNKNQKNDLIFIFRVIETMRIQSEYLSLIKFWRRYKNGAGQIRVLEAGARHFQHFGVPYGAGQVHESLSGAFWEIRKYC